MLSRIIQMTPVNIKMTVESKAILVLKTATQIS